MAIVLGQACTPPPVPEKIVAYPSGTIIEGVGTSDIPITSQSEKAKVLVRQGFALLHCFWFNESVRSFRDATKEDPTCAMAWCGLNISLTQPWFVSDSFKAEANYAIQRAVQLSGESSDFEQEMIAAYRLRSFGKDDRGGDFEGAMNDLLAKHPEVMEARLVWAGIRCQRCMGASYDKNGNNHFELEKVHELIKPVLAKDPTNPAALHYHIHSVEGSDPQSAVASARQLGKSAPGSGHMLHMPGHIFYNVGLWDEGRAAFESCRAKEEAYAKELGVPAMQATWNYSHNVHFLTYHLAEMGRLKESRERLALLGDKGAQMLMERTGDWVGLSRWALKARDDSGSEDFANWVLGKVSLQSGSLEDAKRRLIDLDELVGELEGKDEPWRKSDLYTAESFQQELKGAIALKENQPEEALAAYDRAMAAFEKIEYSEPPRNAHMVHESVGWSLLEAGRAGDAEAAFRRGLKLRPNSGWLLFGVAEAVRAKDGAEAAKGDYEEFLKQWKDADPDLPYLLKARERMAEIGELERGRGF